MNLPLESSMGGNDESALFEAAVRLDGPRRKAFLEQACAGKPELLRRLNVLLAAHEQSRDSLATEAIEARDESPFRPLLSQQAFADDDFGGRYKLLEKIGEGGCGEVYVAEQLQPVRRRVALKLIKLGMDTKSVVARFEAERQALALMDHPNIARVLDAGATSLGRPFFVMELVRGVRITDYCDRNRLDIAQRLDLFTKVCHAIQHAHQKGIIHRDIKPSNILVTLHDGVPVPKVIDFGIAKATEGRLTDATIYTQLQQFIGTPAYMSPEQAELSGLDIDTRSDIYSFGVLLYELLTGRTPFDAKELVDQGLDQMRKIIREVEPPRPSTRLSTMAGEALSTTADAQRIPATQLVRRVQGDLDWIVMKCLEQVLSMGTQAGALNQPKMSTPLLALGTIFRALNANALGQHAQARSMADEIGRSWKKWGIPEPPPNFKQAATKKAFEVSDDDAAWLAYRELTEALAVAPRP